jgi:hypothetical protein
MAGGEAVGRPRGQGPQQSHGTQKFRPKQVTARGLETAVNSKAMVGIARSIDLYNSAYRLAWQHVSERQKREQPDVAQRLHESIARQLKEGASLDVLIASEALSELTK